MSDGSESAVLLVRRADPAYVGTIRPLLRGVEAGDLRVLATRRGVTVLGDAALPLSAPPLAAMAVGVDRVDASAEMVAAGVVSTLRRRGLGRRLFDGTAMLLRSEGIQAVQVTAEPGTPGAQWLEALGFRHDDGSSVDRLIYWL